MVAGLPRLGGLARRAYCSAFAQSPWERAASNLEAAFTGPLARSLALVAIVIGGLMFMFGEGGAKRQISGIVFGPSAMAVTATMGRKNVSARRSPCSLRWRPCSRWKRPNIRSA